MQAVTPGFLSALRLGYEQLVRVALLNDSLEEIEEWTGQDGYVLTVRVSMDRTRAPRRSCAVRLVNPGGVLSKKAMATEFLSHHFKVQMGMRDNRGAELVDLGIYMVDQPRGEFGHDNESLDIQAMDMWKHQRQRKLRAAVVFPIGTRLEEVVITLGEFAGYPRSSMILDDGGKSIGVEVTLDPWASVGDELLKLVDEHTLELFFDAFGRFTLKPAIKSGMEPDPVFDFRAGEDSVLTQVSKGLSDTELYNAVGVSAESTITDAAPVYAEARDLNPLSPAYNPWPGTDPAWPLGGGPLGDRLLNVTHTSALGDEAAAYSLAEQKLWENAMVEEEYELQMAPVMHLEPGDVVRLTHPESDSDDVKLLIDGIELSSGTNPMSISVKRLRSLVAP